MLDRLPRDTLATTLDQLSCPWCGQEMGEAPLTLEAVHQAHVWGERGLRWAGRETDGQAVEEALKVACPTCGKGAIVAFQLIHREPATRLMAVRTAADVAWAANAVRAPEPT